MADLGLEQEQEMTKKLEEEEEKQELKKKIAEANEELKKVREEYKMKMLRNRFYKYLDTGKIPDDLDLGSEEVKDLLHVIDLDLKRANHRIQQLKKAQVTTNSQATTTTMVDDDEEKGKEPEPLDGNLKI